MKNKKDIKVEMVRVDGDLMPFIKVEYVDKNAQEHTGVMILDSCCVENVLTSEMTNVIDMTNLKENGENTKEIITLDNERTTVSEVDFSFAMGGSLFHEPFIVCDSHNHLPNLESDYPTIGILGNLFFQKHHLAVDFSDFTLHTSHATPKNLPISDCDFFFPMEIGLKNYGLPMISIRKDGKDIVTMADSGATNNMIAAQTIKEHSLECEYLETSESVLGLTGEIETPKAKIGFSLLTLAKDKKVGVISRRETFNVFPRYFMPSEKIDRDGDSIERPPVEAIISCPFMAKEGWVLDFGIKHIYKRRVFSEKMNPRVKIQKGNNSENNGSGIKDKMEDDRIRFFADATETEMPFIRIDEGDFEGLVMLIDTGSNSNIIFGYAYHQLGDLLKPEKEKHESFGIDGDTTVVSSAKGVVTFCGRKYEMTFLIRENNDAIIMLSEQMGFPIAGIIGTTFMAEHGWMLDFGKQEVVIPIEDIGTIDFQAIRKNKEQNNN